MEFDLTAAVLATGALGTAAFGIVEGFKMTRLGLTGYRLVAGTLGSAAMEAISRAYGRGYDTYLQGLYRQGRAPEGLGRALRQGLRLGLRADNANALAAAMGVAELDELQSAARKLEEGQELDDAERSVVGRFELAADARIDAALADAQYKGVMQVGAAAVAIVLAQVAAWSLAESGTNYVVRAFIVGIAAVPLAPIAKDVAEGIKSARKALGAKA